MSNTIYAIGFMSGMYCYLNISQEEAEKRYLLENPDTEGDYTIKKITFDDVFESYSVYGGEEVESVFSANNLREKAEANNWDMNKFIVERNRLLVYLADRKSNDIYEVTIQDAANHMGATLGDILVLADDLSSMGILNINVAMGNSGGSFDLATADQTLELY